MRCSCTFFGVILFLLLFHNGTSQGIADSLAIVKTRHDLPGTALKSKFRIQVSAAESKKASPLLSDAKGITSKFKLNTYVIRYRDLIKLHAGDFHERKYAKQRLHYLKRKFPGAKIVKADNDSIIEFFIVEKKKPSKGTVNPVTSENPAKQYVIKIDPPLKPPDPPKDTEIQNALLNTAGGESYLSDEEKRVFYFLNLVRSDPKRFAETYLPHLKNSRDSYESTLYDELLKLKALPLLKPDLKLYESAKCHALESGERGYVGHDRFRCTKYFMGECCQYGYSDAYQIIIDLLVDRGVSSLGHRRICLSPAYTKLGVSIQPHKSYGVNTVMDFR